MLIVALVLAVIGLAALVTAVVTSNEVIAWVCIGASALGVILLVVDAVRDRQSRRVAVAAPSGVDDGENATEVADLETTDGEFDADADVYAADTDDEAADSFDTEIDSAPTEVVSAIRDEELADAAADEAVVEEIAEEIAVEDHPDEVVHDEPEYDTYSDDEPEYPEPAEESAVHTVTETETEGR